MSKIQRNGNCFAGLFAFFNRNEKQKAPAVNVRVKQPMALIDVAKKISEGYQALVMNTDAMGTEQKRKPDVWDLCMEIKKYQDRFFMLYGKKYGQKSLLQFKTNFMSNLASFIDEETDKQEKRMSRKLFILPNI